VVNLNVFERIRQAAEQGDAFAQFELALALDFGNGGEQDFDKAAVWSFDTNHGRLSLDHSPIFNGRPERESGLSYCDNSGKYPSFRTSNRSKLLVS